MTPEQVCPVSIGSVGFKLALENPAARPRAHQPVAITIDSTPAGRLGVQLPIEIRVSSGSSAESFRSVIYRDMVPTRFVFFPHEGGPHVVRVSEVYHQRFVGILQLDVEGDRLDSSSL